MNAIRVAVLLSTALAARPVAGAQVTPVEADVCVVGGGSGGMGAALAAARAAKHHVSVAEIDVAAIQRQLDLSLPR